MNGDLSLSQSLGGLRIANPDDDVNSPTSPSSSSSRIHDALDYHHPIPPSQNRPHPSTASSPPWDGASPRYRMPLGSQGVDVDALGFNPAAYSAGASSFNSPSHSTSATDYPGHSRKLSHRQSMPIAHEAAQQAYYAPRGPNRTYNYPLDRPISGFYNHTNMSTSSGPTPEIPYQRARAESNQSSYFALRRSNSRTAGNSPLGTGTSSARAPPPAPYRQNSYSGHVSPPHPPRMSSKPPGIPPDSNGATGQPMRSRGSSQGNAYAPNPPPEDLRDRAPAAAATKPVDQDGKTSSKAVKKGVKDFTFGRTLGEGSYSTVLAATDRQTLREYAIKVLDKRHIIKEKKVKYVNIEKDTLNRLTDHPGIVRLYYTFQDERSLYFVLDLATGGELLGVLKKMTSFDEECTRFYGAQILDAVEYMHLRGVIHRDLKPENVLLDDQMHVKITDFGTAKILDITGKAQFGKVSVNNDPLDGADTDRAVSFVGTAEYVSPELLTDKNACKASDLWAFGCIIYQLLAGRPPFKAGNEYQTFQKIVHLEYTFPEGFPHVARDLVRKLLVLSPGERLPIDDIKRHPFFNGIQWGKGLWKQKAPKLRSYVPPSTEESSDVPVTALPLRTPASGPSSNPSNPPQRPQPRVITELAPPSQLDIEWSPVLTKTNERIAKLGQLVVHSTPAPYSPTSRNGPSSDPSSDTPSKFSRFFSATTTKKRQRLVMITSSARLVLAPSGGDKKEAKHVINLLDPDVSWKSQQDAKGYTVWSVSTRDKHLTFEDPKANTGDPGSSIRSSQEWLDLIESVKEYATSQGVNSYQGDSMNPLGPSLSNPTASTEGDASMTTESHSSSHRRILRKEISSTEDDSARRRRFSKRHSKNGFPSVF